MTDEKRIEEIRARHAAYLGGDRHSYSRADVYAPDDVGELLAALDAERARAVRGDAAMSDIADFLAWEENRWIATGDSVPDAVRKVVLGLRAERDARPAITADMAFAWSVDERENRSPHSTGYDEMRSAAKATKAALLAHAAKVRTSPARCEICDWPLHDTIDKGCTAESCSYRPDVGSEEHRRIAARRKEIAAKAGGGT